MWLRSWIRRLTSTLRESQAGLLVLALLVGAGAGVGAVAFRWLISTFTRLFSGHEDFSAASDPVNPHLPWLGRWFVVLVPIVAGLLYGPIVHRWAKEARGHGVPEVMYATARRGGVIRPQVAAVKSLASALCIGGGGSVGREGPIVQVGAALGSTVGGVVRVPEMRRRVLVACGAAGGIAATFNAPLAGVFFAMELILSDFAAQAFGMVVLSAVTASVIGRAALGDEPFLALPTLHVDHVDQYLLFAALGVLCGLIGVAFTRFLYAVEDACDRIWRGPEWLRPGVGGLLLGVLLLLLPQLYGVGYPVLGNGVAGKYAVGFLLVLLLGKMVATSLTIGIGGSGGVFAPSLFIGAMAGAAFGQTTHLLDPALSGGASLYAVLGMGAVFAGAARAPITAVIIMFELTGEYSLILPLMTAVVLATGVSHLVARDTIYTLKLRRRGIDLHEPVHAHRMRVTTAAAVMEPAGEPVPSTTPLMELVGPVGRSRYGMVPVVDDDGCYQGVVTTRSMAQVLADDERPSELHAADLCTWPRAVAADDSLEECLSALREDDVTAIPVLDDPTDGPVTGWVSTDAVLTHWRALAGAPSLA